MAIDNFQHPTTCAPATHHPTTHHPTTRDPNMPKACPYAMMFFLMIRRPPRSTQGVSSAASDVYKRQAHYYGKGFDAIESVGRSDTTTRFRKTSFLFYPRVVWELKPGFFLGPAAEISFASSKDINPVMAADPYFNAFRPRYLNVGLGGVIQYDTRDDICLLYTSPSPRD